ncbi:MAG: hypothetical protein R3B55_02805 [Candidatus Paceibacterota bacterium]
MLAHGRIHITDKIDANNWYLVKFSDPKKDNGKKIKLTHKVRPNHDSGAWIKESIKFIYEQMHRVARRSVETFWIRMLAGMLTFRRKSTTISETNFFSNHISYAL